MSTTLHQGPLGTVTLASDGVGRGMRVEIHLHGRPHIEVRDPEELAAIGEALQRGAARLASTDTRRMRRTTLPPREQAVAEIQPDEPFPTSVAEAAELARTLLWQLEEGRNALPPHEQRRLAMIVLAWERAHLRSTPEAT